MKPAMAYEYQEYPKTLYRWGPDGERLGHTFGSADEVTPGWVEFTALGEWAGAVAPEPESEAPPATVEAEAPAAPPAKPTRKKAG